jgi:hypothetical protein
MAFVVSEQVLDNFHQREQKGVVYEKDQFIDIVCSYWGQKR